MTFSISNLPEPDLIEELDFETIFRELVTDFRARHPGYTALLESDPAIKLMQVFAYRELVLRQRVNDAFKATLLAFAQANDLENLSAFYGLNRLDEESDAALRDRTIERIKGSSTAGGAAWYRYQALTADERVGDALVTSPQPGQVRVAILSREAEFIRDFTGTQLNEFAAIYGISRLNNNETDAQFRARLRPLVLGTAGDGAASQNLVNVVNTKLQADDVRVVTDVVTVVGATIVLVNVAANVYLYPDTPSAVLTGLDEALRAEFRANATLGWDLTTSWIISRLHVRGVQRVELVSPSSVVVADATTAVALGNITITLAGYDR